MEKLLNFVDTKYCKLFLNIIKCVNYWLQLEAPLSEKKCQVNQINEKQHVGFSAILGHAYTVIYDIPQYSDNNIVVV